MLLVKAIERKPESRTDHAIVVGERFLQHRRLESLQSIPVNALVQAIADDKEALKQLAQAIATDEQARAIIQSAIAPEPVEEAQPRRFKLILTTGQENGAHGQETPKPQPLSKAKLNGRPEKADPVLSLLA